MSRPALIRLAVIALLVGALEIATRAGWVDSYTMIPPSVMASALGDILASGRLTGAILYTLQNVAAAFVIAIAVGFVIGATLYRLPRIRRAMEPLLASYYAVPVFIFYPLFIVMFGLNAWPLIAVGFLFAVAAVVINTMNSFDRVRPVLGKTARALRMSRTQETLLITLPAAAPYLFTGLKLAVAYAFIGVVAGEFILSGAGLGYEIAFAYNSFDNRTMYGLMLFLLIFVTVINMTLHTIERRLHARRQGR
jgi:NitT/TauT family transport system permease protein